MSHHTEFVIRADEDELAAYLAGFAAGAGLERAFVMASESGFHVSALRERLKHHGETAHVICDDAHGERLRAVIARAPSRFQFEVKAERRIERAYFPFSFETPSKDVAARIKGVMSALPPGIRATDYAPEELTDPDARGAEVYSPTHEYTFRGRGVIEGDVPGVIAARRALMEIEFTKCDEISVHYAT